jgi:hypothetical protein
VTFDCRCKHFTGIQHATCGIGLAYPTPSPCLTAANTSCAQRELLMPYVILHLSAAASNEILAKLEAAGHQRAITLPDGRIAIDLHSTSVVAEPKPVESMNKYDPIRPEWAKDVLLTFVYLLMRDVGSVAGVRDALVEAARIGASGQSAVFTDRELSVLARRVIARADIEAMPSTPEFDG